MPVGDINNKQIIKLSWFHPVNDPNITNNIYVDNIYNFESWPSLINGWVINTWLSANISHRQRQVPRTFIIQKLDWSSDIWIYNTEITLADLSKYISDLHIYTWNYNVINLDLGRSSQFCP